MSIGQQNVQRDCIPGLPVTKGHHTAQGQDAAQVCETYQEPPIRLRRNKGPGASCALDNNDREREAALAVPAFL